MANKKVSIVFHSVCGNNYLIAKDFYEQFKSHDADVNIYRVEDPNFESLAVQFPIAGQYKNDILNVKVGKFEDMLDSDIIIMGSPTYYGNVSGAMKSFMDSFSPCWSEAKLWGKKLFSFSTSGNPEGGGDMCLNTMNIFAQHMGMIVVPVPSNLVSGQSYPAYGLLHYVGDFSNIRINVSFKTAIKEMTERLLDL